jgi:hypothetical protein
MHHFCQHQVLEERITTKRNQGDEPYVAIKLPPFELYEEMKSSLEKTFRVRELTADCGTERAGMARAEKKNSSIKLNPRPLKANALCRAQATWSHHRNVRDTILNIAR